MATTGQAGVLECEHTPEALASAYLAFKKDGDSERALEILSASPLKLAFEGLFEGNITELTFDRSSCKEPVMTYIYNKGPTHMGYDFLKNMGWVMDNTRISSSGISRFGKDAEAALIKNHVTLQQVTSCSESKQNLSLGYIPKENTRTGKHGNLKVTQAFVVKVGKVLVHFLKLLAPILPDFHEALRHLAGASATANIPLT